MTGRTLADSSVLLDLLTDDPIWKQWSVEELERAAKQGPVIINEIIYTEISIGFSRIEELDRVLAALPLEYQIIPLSALFLAGKAFLAYRKKGGTKTVTLPDFYIGAHAAVSGFTLLTRDPGRICRYFPTVQTASP